MLILSFNFPSSIEFRPILILTNVRADILHHAIAKTAEGRKPIHQALRM